MRHDDFVQPWICRAYFIYTVICFRVVWIDADEDVILVIHDDLGGILSHFIDHTAFLPSGHEQGDPLLLLQPHLLGRRALAAEDVLERREQRVVLAAPQASIMQALVQGFMSRQPVAWLLFSVGAMIVMCGPAVSNRSILRSAIPPPPMKTTLRALRSKKSGNQRITTQPGSRLVRQRKSPKRSFA